MARDVGLDEGFLMAIDARPLLERGKLGWMTSRPRSLPLTAVAGALVTSLAGCSAIGSASGIHPGGDPQGQVLQSLEAATKVLPGGIQVIRATNLEATWSDACPSNPYGRSGWGPVLSGSWFNSQTNQARARQRVQRHRRGAGMASGDPEGRQCLAVHTCSGMDQTHSRGKFCGPRARI